MQHFIRTLTAALSLSISSGALAQAVSPVAPQTAAPSVAAATVGQWLHDPQGAKIGSVRGLTDGGRTAVLMIGSYFQPGSHEARVPAYALSIVNGKAALRAETVEALNVAPGR